MKKIGFALFVTWGIIACGQSGQPPQVQPTPPPPSNHTGPSLYVSPSGLDSNPGTQEQPFKTIAYADKVASAGATIHVAPGTYFGGFTTMKSGTATAPVTFTSDTKWGAKIIPPQAGGSSMGWHSTGDYVIINGFDISGLITSPGVDWRFALYAEGNGTQIINNRLHDILTDAAAAHAANASGNGGAIVEIQLGANGNNPAYTGTISNNLVYNIGFDASNNREGGIYFGSPGVIANNIVYGIAGGVAITPEKLSSHVNCVNNTIFHSRFGIYLSNDTPGEQVTTNWNVNNNIIYDTVYALTETTGSGVAGHNIFSNNNISLASQATYRLSVGASNFNPVNGDPQFVNYVATGGGDYHLKPNSVDINSGTSVGAPTTDFDGTPRPQGGAFDVGAYERVSP